MGRVPRLSVVIRSFNRLDALAELIAALRQQRHDDFEIVVVEQSTQVSPEAAAKLAEHERDPRVRIERVPPQGGARARNMGVALSRGRILVFIDDDDLPMGDDFLAKFEEVFAEDPKILGVTCRHTWGDQTISSIYRRMASRRVMRFSAVTRIPMTYPRYDAPAVVDYVHGTGGAYRRSVFERFGMWDEDTPIEDEASVALRMRGKTEPGERFVFDPRPLLLRRMDVSGGLAKRYMTPGQFYKRFMTFIHRIVRRYHPNRVHLLYPAYVWAAWIQTIGWLWDGSLAHSTTPRRLAGTVVFTLTLPWHAVATLVGGTPIKKPIGPPITLPQLSEAATADGS